MVYNENIVLEDSVYVDSQYLIPTWFDSVKLTISAENQKKDNMKLSRVNKQNNYDSFQESVDNEHTVFDSTFLAETRQSKEFRLNTLANTANYNENPNANDTSVNNSEENTNSLRAISGVQESNENIQNSNVTQQLIQYLGMLHKVWRYKEYDFVFKIRVNTIYNNDTLANINMTTPKTFNSFDINAKSVIGLLPYINAGIYNDLAYGSLVFGFGVIGGYENYTNYLYTKETQRFDEINDTAVNRNREYINAGNSAVNNQEKYDNNNYNEVREFHAYDYEILSLIAKNRKERFLTESRVNQTKQSYFNVYTRVSLAEHMLEFMLESRVNKLTNGILEHWVYNHLAYNDFAFGDFVEYKFMRTQPFLDNREYVEIDSETEVKTNEYKEKDLTNNTRANQYSDLFVIQDTITFSIPVEVLETPYEIPETLLVEKGNTMQLVFYTQEYEKETDTFTPTLGFKHQGYIADLGFNRIKTTSMQEFPDRKKWLINVFTNDLNTGQEYYACFKWEINGSKKMQRIKFRVVEDVNTLKHISENELNYELEVIAMPVLSTDTYWLNKNMSSSKSVEIGNTIDLEFHTMERDEATKDYVVVAADTATSRLVSTDLQTTIKTLAPENVSTGIYRVAMPFLDSDVDVNNEYYIEFEWELSGVQKLIREKIKVVADVIL